MEVVKELSLLIGWLVGWSVSSEGHEVLLVVTMKITGFWDVMQCRFTDNYQF
jgi:hypothetical protein